MIAGAKLFGYPGKIMGLVWMKMRQDLKEGLNLATETASLLDESIRFSPEEILVNANYLGKGYGILEIRKKKQLNYLQEPRVFCLTGI